MMRTLRLLVVLVLSASALAEPSGGEERFTVTLQPAAAHDAASAAKRLASTYGGTLEDGESGGESFIVQISASRARLMAADPHVAAVAPTAQAAVPPEIVTWSSGVTFSYDGSGNIRQIGQDKFGYDAVGRLVHAKVNEVVRDYQYDAFGNRESCSQAAGTEDCQAGYTVDPATNRIAEIQYDPAGSGNVIGFRGHTYAYDALNMMTSDTFVGTREFIYTPDDERIGTYSNVSRSWQWTIRNTSGKILREFVSDGGSIGAGTWTWSKDYVWRDGVLLASRQTNGTTTNTFHYHLDHLGSPRRITDGNDRIVGFHDYFAFGVEAGGHDEQPQSRLQYTGHERDAQGDDFASLDYMLARYYSPMLGRFLSVDPGGMDLRKPQSWNRYGYTQNNPINAVDPDGRETQLVVGGYTKINPLGHVAIAINGKLYSYGTNYSKGHPNRRDWGVPLQAYLGPQNALRQTQIVTLKITPAQEAALQAHLEANNPNARGAPNYNELSNSCVTVSENGLDIVGILPNEPGPVTIDHAGNELQAGAPKAITPEGLLSQAQAAGLVSSTTVVGTEPKQSKMRSWWNAIVDTLFR